MNQEIRSTGLLDWALLDAMTAIEVRLVESAASDPQGLEGLTITYRESVAEVNPDDPPPSSREAFSELLGPSVDRIKRAYLATVDGVPAGQTWMLTISEPSDQLQVAEAEIFVRKQFRRRGVADALAARLLADLEDLGQRSVICYRCAETVPEASLALCEKYGLTKRADERCSRVRVEDIDEALLDDWIAAAETKAEGYRIEQWVGEVPAEFEDLWAQAAAAMEDEPLEDIEYNPYTRSAEVRREADRTKVSHGYRIHRTLCLSPDGGAAGLSAIYLHEDRPQIGHQGDTGVLAAHRGHGLGKWMKAANYRSVRKHHPELAVIETYNNETNPWMLAINVAMGFAPHRHYLCHQGPVKQATR